MEAKQKEMRAALEANRDVMPHEGEKGASAEMRWVDWLTAYLPRRYSVAKGFVVDCSGATSEQIDVIIHDAQYSPFLFHSGSSCFVPAESVYAVFDAKQEISAKSLSEAGQKAASVRSLSRTSGPIWTNAGGPLPGKPPDNQPILGGILAVASSYRADDPFGTAFRARLGRLPPSARLDLGLALSAGAFEVPPQGDGKPIVYSSRLALVGFFVALMRQLQPLATALAMDLEAWGTELRNQQ